MRRLILALIAAIGLAWSAPAAAATAYVNSACGDASGAYGTAATSVATAATSLTGGNTLLVFTRQATGSVSSISDTAGNTFTAVTGSGNVSGSSTKMEFWYAKNVTGNGSNVVTANFSTSTGGRVVCTVQLSGASTTAPINYASAGRSVTTGTDITSNPYTTNAADAVLVACANIDATTDTWSTPSGWTFRVKATNGVYSVYTKDVAAIQTLQTVTITNSDSSAKDLILVSAAASTTAGTEHAYPFIR